MKRITLTEGRNTRITPHKLPTGTYAITLHATDDDGNECMLDVYSKYPDTLENKVKKAIAAETFFLSDYKQKRLNRGTVYHVLTNQILLNAPEPSTASPDVVDTDTSFVITEHAERPLPACDGYTDHFLRYEGTVDDQPAKLFIRTQSAFTLETLRKTLASATVLNVFGARTKKQLDCNLYHFDANKLSNNFVVDGDE